MKASKVFGGGWQPYTVDSHHSSSSSRVERQENIASKNVEGYKKTGVEGARNFKKKKKKNRNRKIKYSQDRRR